MQRLLGVSILLILFANVPAAQDVPATPQATTPAKDSADSSPQDTATTSERFQDGNFRRIHPPSLLRNQREY